MISLLNDAKEDSRVSLSHGLGQSMRESQVVDILWECERESERCLESLMRMELTCSYPYKEQEWGQREE